MVNSFVAGKRGPKHAFHWISACSPPDMERNDYLSMLLFPLSPAILHYWVGGRIAWEAKFVFEGSRQKENLASSAS